MPFEDGFLKEFLFHVQKNTQNYIASQDDGNQKFDHAFFAAVTKDKKVYSFNEYCNAVSHSEFVYKYEYKEVAGHCQVHTCTISRQGGFEIRRVESAIR